MNSLTIWNRKHCHLLVRLLLPWTVFLWIACICLYDSFFFASLFWLRYYVFCYYNSYIMVQCCWPCSHSFVLLFSFSALDYNVLILQFNIQKNLISEFLRPNSQLSSSNWYLLSSLYQILLCSFYKIQNWNVLKSTFYIYNPTFLLI